MSSGWIVSPFADLGWKSLDLLMRVSAYYLVRSGFGLTQEVLTALPSPAKLLFLFKAHWEIPAVFSGVLWTVGLGFLILWNRKEQISDSWLQRKATAFINCLAAQWPLGPADGKKMSLFPRCISEISGGNQEFRIQNICLSFSCPFYFPSDFSLLPS